MDYSRVSSDASPWWDHSILRIGNVRERVATYNALVSTLHRWPMNNVMFGNDPDVFFVRSNNNQLTADERYTLVVVNNLLGQMALMSDNVALYSSLEHALYSQTFPKAQVTMGRMDTIGSDVYRLHYLCNGRPYVTFTNLSPRPFHFRLPTIDNDEDDSVYFENGNALLNASSVQWIDAKKDGLPLKLRPHQTRTFMRIVDDFAGSTGHILPGWDIETIDRHKQDMMLIRLRQPRLHTLETRLYFKAHHGDDTKVVFVDDKKINAIHQDKLKNDAVPFPLIYLDYPIGNVDS
jgi:alpha-galactosidase